MHPSSASPLDELGEALDPPSTEPPTRLRNRVLTKIEQSPRRRLPPVLSRPRRRLALTALTATAVTAALVIVPTLRVGSAAPPASAQAQEILANAAATAQREPVLKPSQRQYLYFKTVVVKPMTTAPGPSGDQYIHMSPLYNEEWLSPNGDRPGQVRVTNRQTGATTLTGPSGCTAFITLSAGASPAVGTHSSPPCTPDGPAYLNDLPTTVSGMLDYLNHYRAGSSPLPPAQTTPDQRAFHAADLLLNQGYVPPRSLTALFDAVAEIPGSEVVQHVTDASGRSAIAVTHSYNYHGDKYNFDTSLQLLFNPHTYAFLGVREVVLPGSAPAKAGSIIFERDVLEVAVVDRLGQQPKH
jgi:hypothetical protein